MQRLTVACPDALHDDANQLAAAWGLSMADAGTFGPNAWRGRDAQGNLFAVACVLVSETWLAATQQPVARPAWDTAEQIDLAAAARAQARLSLWTPDMGTPPPAASTTAITAICQMDGPAALAALGLTEIGDEAN